jgi:general secretion pathway protein I
MLVEKRGGFTLLEVMVATAILGLTLTVILSAQGGLAASNKIAANMGRASTLARCKMTELEEKQMKLGYPLIDDLQSDVPCCDDRPDLQFTCDTRVEKVVLPNPPQNSLDGGASMLGLSSSASAMPSAGGLPGQLGSILGAAPTGSGGAPGLDFDGGLQGFGQNFMQQQLGMGPGGAAGASSSGMGMQGLLSMVMGLVYPTIKPMFEASIRRVTVTVKWKEGPNARQLGIVQYITNPQSSGFAAGVAPSASASASGGAVINSLPTPGGALGVSPGGVGGGRF